MFALRSADWSLCAHGVKRRVPSGPADTLGERIQAFFAARHSGDSPDLVVGAIPFDRRHDDVIYQPEEIGVHDAFAALSTAASPAKPVRIAAVPSPAGYMDAVSRALVRLAAADELSKLVLCRSLRLDFSRPIDAAAVAARLARDESVTTFIADVTGPHDAAARRIIVGATPELLVERHGLSIASHPLAGSAPRSRDLVADRQFAASLLRSEKNRREHAIVVESILDLLSPLCARLDVPDAPALRSTATMWHLGTRIEGTLKDKAISSAALAALLHPTPAVSGYPREASQVAIRELEQHDRGFYAGAVGWTDAAGDGRWYVILRCAEIIGPQVTLHAGAGIVTGSDPAAEVNETSAKFRAMLDALDIDERTYLDEQGRVREGQSG